MSYLTTVFDLISTNRAVNVKVFYLLLYSITCTTILHSPLNIHVGKYVTLVGLMIPLASKHF